MSRIIKIKDLLGVDICLDVYDDYVDELQINFSGPIWLTRYGRSMFSNILDIEIDVDDDDQVAEVLINDRQDPEYDLERVAKFFHAAAGYCSEELFEKCFTFEEGEDDQF